MEWPVKKFLYMMKSTDNSNGNLDFICPRCGGEDLISCYDGECHALLGKWYCYDCKDVVEEKDREKIEINSSR